MEEKEICCVCGKSIHGDGIGTGHGIDEHGNKVCYECCGKRDAEQLAALEPGTPMYLYLSGEYVTNWPGTLKIRIIGQRTGRHNIAGTQTNVWFRYGGRNYHGTQYGNDSEICRVTALKEKRAAC